ncbi:hypothetical protein BpHYR1_042734 [Brachionus plicatilis]|uniref:Uncharacterized protein n=1 Tax=Brachionus plicatilis TaxID=10195 RepID=A0A3M7SBD3_BRAPC|nr:hypothetical protein BpHYR1_042734 [Brachionus plicatilis]
MKKSIARDEDNMIINYTNSTMANVEVQNQNIKINNQNIKTYRSAVEHLNFKSFDEFYGILRQINKYKLRFIPNYRKLVTITLGTMSKFGFIPYGTNTIETIVNLDSKN